MTRFHYLLMLCCFLVFEACTKELVYESPIEYHNSFIDGKAEVTLEEAGTLRQKLSIVDDLMSLTSLTIKGPINGSDLKLIREMAGADVEGNRTAGSLLSLDLSQARFVSGGDIPFLYNGKEPCPIEEDNVVPRYGFGYCKLKIILLPDSIVSLEVKLSTTATHWNRLIFQLSSRK